MLPMKITLQPATTFAAAAQLGVCMRGVGVAESFAACDGLVAASCSTSAFSDGIAEGKSCLAGGGVSQQRTSLVRAGTLWRAAVLAEKPHEASLVLSVSRPAEGIESGGRIFANVDAFLDGDALFLRRGMTLLKAGIMFGLPLTAALEAGRLGFDYALLSGFIAGIAAVIIGSAVQYLEDVALLPAFRGEVEGALERLSTVAYYFVGKKDDGQFAAFRKTFDALGEVADDRSGRVYDLRKLMGAKMLAPYVSYAKGSARGARLLPVIAEHNELACSSSFVASIKVEWKASDASPGALDTVLWYLQRGNASVMQWLMKWAAGGHEAAKSLLVDVQKRMDRDVFVSFVRAAGYDAETTEPRFDLGAYRNSGETTSMVRIRVDKGAATPPQSRARVAVEEGVEITAETDQSEDALEV